MLRKLLIITVLLFPFSAGFAQIGGFLKDKGTKALKGLGKEKAEDQKDRLDAERDKLDSTDFNFAITIIDNSGMMSVSDLSEKLIKTGYGAANIISKDKKTPAEECRDLLAKGQFAYEHKRFKVAEFYFKAARVAYETQGLTSNINYSKTFSNMGLIYATTGRFNSALEPTKKGMEIQQTTLGEKSYGYAASLNNRAVLNYDLAFYNESAKDFELAKKAVGTLTGQSQELSIVLNNEAILFARMGRYDEAITNLKAAIGILDKANKKNLRNQVGLQSNLALVYQQTNKLTDAETIYLKLERDLGRNVLGENPYYAGVLNNLALLYVQMNKPDKVEDYLKRSADVYASKFGKESPQYAKVIGDQGWFYRTKERYAEAEPLLLKALEIREKALGVNHPDYVKSKEEVAILYWKQKQWDKAYDHYKAVMEKTIDFINQYFPPLSESEKTSYWDLTFPRFQRYYNFAIESGESLPNTIQDVFDYQTATKGLLLNTTSKVKTTILQSGNVDLVNEYLAWLDQKESLARYYSLSKEEIAEQKINLDSIEQVANRLEKSLSEKSKDFSNGYATQKANYKDIQKALGDDEAIVEIIHARTFVHDFTVDSRYMALILTKAMAKPKLVVMDNGAQLETRYAKFYKNSIQQKSNDENSYTQYWSKIEPALQGKKVIYLSPDGVYNQINLNTLKNPAGVYLLSNYDIITIGNSKDLLTLKTSKPSGKKDAVLLGFPDYGGTTVAALPGTKLELDGVNKILKASGFQSKQFMQKDASEANLKAVKSPGLLHIATHGYFQKDTEVKEGGAIGVSLENAQDNPLLRSGLLLANASNTMNGTADVDILSNDNGVLTAYEAMNLKLDGTDMIVLSACETGLGEVKAGEGVYGLQRAFQVAGAKALVMSLWKVDDTATQQLMANFYAIWAKTGNKHKAFRQAQLQLMTKYKEPYYWGAFVMTGF